MTPLDDSIAGQLQLSVYLNSGLLTLHIISARNLKSCSSRGCNSYVKVRLARTSRWIDCDQRVDLVGFLAWTDIPDSGQSGTQLLPHDVDQEREQSVVRSKVFFRIPLGRFVQAPRDLRLEPGHQEKVSVALSPPIRKNSKLTDAVFFCPLQPQRIHGLHVLQRQPRHSKSE